LLRILTKPQVMASKIATPPEEGDFACQTSIIPRYVLLGQSTTDARRRWNFVDGADTTVDYGDGNGYGQCAFYVNHGGTTCLFE
jgi:hypothetical protein